MKNLGIYYINLDARADKDKAARDQLSTLSIPFKRIRAVPDTEISSPRVEYRYSHLISAVKQSHVNACLEFMKSKNDLALILEDDFKLDLSKFEENISDVIDSMKHKSLNFLQIGYLEYNDTKSGTYLERIARILLEKLLRFYFFVKHPFSDVVPRNIRWGAQAYLIDKRGAESLVNSIDILNQNPMDLELRIISKKSEANENFFRMARLKRNLVPQNSNFKSDIQGVY
jgi:GR25 family glycosyltransferase involved in LPS biosynthesis